MISSPSRKGETGAQITMTDDWVGKIRFGKSLDLFGTLIGVPIVIGTNKANLYSIAKYIK